MPNLGKYEPKSPYEYQNTYYDKKTSDYGHYEPEITGKRYGRNGDHATVTQMRWVEDDRKFEAPAADAPVEEYSEPTEEPLVQLSQRAASANAGTDAYENVLLNRQGSATIGADPSPVQDFKNAYQTNLTEELKAQAPTTLAAKKAEIELADKQKTDMADSYELNLSNSASPAQQKSGMTFS